MSAMFSFVKRLCKKLPLYCIQIAPVSSISTIACFNFVSVIELKLVLGLNIVILLNVCMKQVVQ